MTFKRLLIGILATALTGGTLFLVSVTDSTPTGNPSVVPEYERTLAHVILSLGNGDDALGACRGLLDRLPAHARVSLLVPEPLLQQVRTRFDPASFRCRVEWIPFPDPLPKQKTRYYLLFPDKEKFQDTGPIDGHRRFRGSPWAQDLFEAAVDRDGRPVLVIPEVHKWFVCPDQGAPCRVESDNRFLDGLTTAGLSLRRVALTFRGGNVLVDRHRGKTLVFCGGDALRLTRTVWRATRDRVPDAREVKERLRRSLGADEVLVISPRRVQPRLLFHLDQAMVFLGDGRVGVTRLVQERKAPQEPEGDVAAVEKLLAEIRRVLRERGYRILDLATPLKDLLHRRFSANGIPYTDPETGTRTYLMPVYSPQSLHALPDHVRQNRSALERIGYRVVLVPTTANRSYGGIHCLANVVE